MKAKELSIGWALRQPDVEESLTRVINNVRNWTSRKSEAFSVIAGERVTRMDVIKAHGAVMVIGFIMVLAGWLEGGAA